MSSRKTVFISLIVRPSALEVRSRYLNRYEGVGVLLGLAVRSDT
jgi:hypothetical protein